MAVEGAEIVEPDWLLLTRNLLRIAIYNISYIRGLFPEEYFSDESVPELGMTIKKLMPVDVESRRLTDWVEQGVYDALQKKCLETLLFCIREKEEGPTIDEYTFKFSYPNSSGEEAAMKFSLTGSKENDATFKLDKSESTQHQIRRLIRICASLITTLDQMPEERTIMMKLMYYDDFTPEDYEPPFFECCAEDDNVQLLAKSFGRLCCVSQRGPILFLDSGASHHVCSDKSYMTDLRSIRKKKQIELTTADGTKFKAKITGSIEFGNIHLSQVPYIPRMKFNVVSIGQLDKQGLMITIINGQFYIIDVMKSILVGEGYRDRKNNDYVLKAMRWVHSESWVIDSLCASHIAGNLAMLTNPQPIEKTFQTPKGSMTASHKGYVKNGPVKLADVMYCRANQDNLISVGTLDSQGCRFTFYNGQCSIVCKDTLREVGRAMLDKRDLLYYLKELDLGDLGDGTRSKRKRNKRV